MTHLRKFKKAGIDRLILALQADGYRVIGPRVHDGGVTFGEVTTVADLASGMRDIQEKGRYRLEASAGGEVFGVVNGAGSLKPFFFAPKETLIELRREPDGFAVSAVAAIPQRLAFLGVRACDLAALAIQDRIFLRDRFTDAHYEARRKDAFFVAVNCTRSAATCFCTSMKTGPETTSGFDLVLTELEDAFLVESGSTAGEKIAAALDLVPASDSEIATVRKKIDECSAGMPRKLDTSQLPALLYEEANNTHWDDIAARCLSCTNCTMVCPTCFCHTVVETPELDGNISRRVREWDSCFSLEHARIHGINFRPAIRDRYRQWLTHKLAGWVDQFGTSGCVGCGRCITWCPAGIDLIEEMAALQANRSGGKA